MTILEIMVSIMILLTMSVIIYQTLSSSIEFNQLLGKRDAVTRSARSTLSKLRRELQVAYLTPSKRSIQTVQTVFVGMDDDPDKLYFSTLAHQRLYRDSRECDQAEVTVWAESSPSEVGDGYVLYHRESPRIDEEPAEQGRVYPLAYNVRSFNTRYMDPQTNEWRDEWDTRDNDTLYRLPRVMEIGLVLIAEDPDDSSRTIDVPFLSRFSLVYGQRLLQDFVGLGALVGGTDSVAGEIANGGVSSNGQQLPRNAAPLPPLGGGTMPAQGSPPPNRNNRRQRQRQGRGPAGSKRGVPAPPTRALGGRK